MLRLSLVRRGLLAGALLAAGGGALALGAPSVAGATPTATKVTGGGSTPVTLGHPKTLAAAAVTPTAVAYTSTTGNIALISGNEVYLVPGVKEANEFNIETAASTFGTLTPADVYLVAGTGTRHIVGNPGTGKTTSTSSTTIQATSNTIAPTSVLFAKNGNLLIGEKNIVSGTQSAVAIQLVAKSATSTGYGVASVVAGGLYSIAGGGLLTQPTREIALGGLFNYDLTLDSTTSQGNIISTTNGSVQYLNFGTTSITRYGMTLTQGAATTITGTPTGVGSCTSGGGHLRSTTPAGPAILGTPSVTVDANNDVYVSDNTTGAKDGCLWLLPASEPSTVDGISAATTGGHYQIYNLTAPTTATAAATNTTANTDYLADIEGLALDTVGNIVLGGGASADKGLWVLAEHTGTYWGTAMTAGKLYKVGVSLTQVTSLVNGVVGHVLLTDPGFLYNVTGGPTTGITPATHTTLTEQPAAGTAYVGTTVTFTAHVTPTSATGTVGFYITGALKSTQPLSDGTAHYSTNTLTAGTYSVQAKFVSSTTTAFSNSTSAVVSYSIRTSTTKVTGAYQQLGETLKAGHLTLSCTQYVTVPSTAIRVCNLITLPSATITGVQQTKTAGMNDLYVNTARGTPTSGWSLSAVMVPSTTIPTTTHNGRKNDNTNATCDGVQGFCNSSDGTHASTATHAQIPATDLSLTGYACTPATTNHNPTPTATAGGTLKTSRVLCTAVAGSAAGEFLVHGGTYTLKIPGTIYKGLYYGTVEFTLTAKA